MATQVILLERVEKLGEMGDVVAVKPGYARNFLLPQRKALRASKDNIAYFEAKKKVLQGENDKRKTEAEGIAKKLEGLKVPLIRQASEAGQLFGSVTSRDIAAEVTASSKEQIDRSQVVLNQNYKSIGLFELDIVLHPEVKVAVTINIARSIEEAEIQAKTGKALVSDAVADAPAAETTAEEAEAQLDEALGDVLEEGALEAEKDKQVKEAEKEAEEEAKAQARAEAKAEADAAKAEEEAKVAAEAEAAEGSDAEEAPAEEEKKTEE